MYDTSIVAVSRAERYSPNSTESDAAILAAVCRELRGKGFQRVACVGEDEPGQWPEADAYITMGRSDEGLRLLQQRQTDAHAVVINRPEGIRLAIDRYRQMLLFEEHGIPVAPREGTSGYWVKRGHGTAETKADVTYVATREEADCAADELLRQGKGPADVRAHVEGDLVKFYGVRESGFFRFFYPGDDGMTKFGDEAVNGRPAHHPFDIRQLQDTADEAARLSQLEVYGGDGIIRTDGTFCIVDLNDWPSFSRCRDDAAQAIASLVIRHIKERKENLTRYV